MVEARCISTHHEAVRSLLLVGGFVWSGSDRKFCLWQSRLLAGLTSMAMENYSAFVELLARPKTIQTLKETITITGS